MITESNFVKPKKLKQSDSEFDHFISLCKSSMQKCVNMFHKIFDFALFLVFQDLWWMLKSSSTDCSGQLRKYKQMKICTHSDPIGPDHGLRTPGEEIAFTTRPKIHSHSQIFRYAEAKFVCHISPNFQISLIYVFIGCPQSVVQTFPPLGIYAQ